MRTLPVFALAVAALARSAAAAEPGAVVALTPEQAERFAVAPAESAEEPREEQALGQVLDPLPFVSALLARETARTAAEIALRERTRTETLARADHNASLRDVEAARLAAARALDEQAAAETRAVGLWGAEALARRDVAAFAERLARGEAALARVDVAAPSFQPARIWVTAPSQGGEERAVRLLGAAPGVDPGLQARGLLVALDADPLPIGAALLGRIEGAEAARGVWLPESAVVWHDGAAWVFVARGANEFERRAVHLTAARRPGFSIGDGVAPGDRVVVSGAQQLLSAELVGGEPAE